MAIKAILFDIDGTLVDSNESHVKAWEEAFRSAGAHIPPDRIREQIGKGTDTLVPALMPGASEDERNSLGEAHGAIFKARYLSDVKAFPHAADLLRHAARAGQQVVLASSASKAELDYYLAFLDVREAVSHSTSADDVAHTKPAPDIFSVALKKVAPITAVEALAVGDTPYDVQSAGKCGIKAVAVRSGGFSDSSLLSAGAIALYDDVAALLADYDNSPLAGR